MNNDEYQETQTCLLAISKMLCQLDLVAFLDQIGGPDALTGSDVLEPIKEVAKKAHTLQIAYGALQAVIAARQAARATVEEVQDS